ncbi:hypothetical protein ACET57_18785 [Aeromonas veronii]|uniref:hypothetical protein n=1 Tax=Aeromonas TaxID=642 RepID=UPI0038D2846B
MKNLSALFIILCVSGCTTISEERQTVSSGQIGCAPKDIQVSDNQQYTWVATCKNKKFICTVAAQVACKEAIE